MSDINHDDLNKLRDDMMAHVNTCVRDLGAKIDHLSETVTRATTQLEERDKARAASCPHAATIVRAQNNIKRLDAQDGRMAQLEGRFDDLRLTVVKIAAPISFLTGLGGQAATAFVMQLLNLP